LDEACRPAEAASQPLVRLVVQIDQRYRITRAARAIASLAVWPFALFAGLIAAGVAVAVMLPLTFPTREDKRTALLAAAADRFFLGGLVGPVAVGLNLNGLLVGAVLGIGLSIGSALVTKSYVPILVMGLVLGIGVGLAYEIRF
jgi:hypothetical protein